MANEVQGALKFNVNGSWIPITTLVGERGPTGGTVDVAIGTVESTSGPTATISRVQNTAYFNFGLPRGERGYTGSYSYTNNLSSSNQTLQVITVTSANQIVFEIPTPVEGLVSDWEVFIRFTGASGSCPIGIASLAKFASLPVYANDANVLSDLPPQSNTLFSFTGFGTGFIMSRANNLVNVNS